MNKHKITLISIILSLFMLASCVGNEEGVAEKKEAAAPTEESLYIVEIEERGFTAEDMEFYTFMHKVKNELNRVKDAEGLSGKELEDSNAFWDNQNELYNNTNVQLQNLIEIYAMSLLAEEKNYFVPMDKIEGEVDGFNAAIAENPIIQKMIKQYGEKNYNLNIRDYTKERMLRDRIASDIEKTVREEHMDASEQEISYLINESYDDLYEDHVSQLKLAINLLE